MVWCSVAGEGRGKGTEYGSQRAADSVISGKENGEVRRKRAENRRSCLSD